MILFRHWIILFIAGGSWVGALKAQDSSADSSDSSGGGSIFGPLPGDSGGSSSPSGSSSGGTSSGASSSFEPEPPAPTTPTEPIAPPPPPGGTAPETPTGGAAATQESAPSFTIPGFYGSPASTYTAGEGRLARPKYQYTFSISAGYDSNIFQTPDNQKPLEQQFIKEEAVAPSVHLERRQVTTGINGGINNPVFEFVPVADPGKEAVIGIKKIPQPGKVGSLVNRGTFDFTYQTFTRRTVFLFDLKANGDYYWSRPAPADKADYNGSVNISFLHRITPRLQVTANLNAAYLTQPDLTRINTPERTGAGDTINITGKLDLTYRWTPRVTSVVSLTHNEVLFVEKVAQNGDFRETTFGTEQRYLWSPRLTLLAELRHTVITYDEDPRRDAQTNFLLMGAEWTYSRNLNTTLRLGAAHRTFDESGNQSISPYMESTVTWRVLPTGIVSWTARYGYEEPVDPESTVLSARSTLAYRQLFSPYLSGSLSGTFIHRTTSSPTIDTTEDIFDTALNVQYSVTREFSLSASLTFTKTFTSQGLTDYNRTQFFLTGEYSF